MKFPYFLGATPFECGVCAYQCRRKPTVLKHMKYVHEGSKPFECPHCQRRFPKLCVMNKHIERLLLFVRGCFENISGQTDKHKWYYIDISIIRSMLEHTVWITIWQWSSGGQSWHHGSRWKSTEERVIGSIYCKDGRWVRCYPKKA